MSCLQVIDRSISTSALLVSPWEREDTVSAEAIHAVGPEGIAVNDWDARIDAEGSGFKTEPIGRSLSERLRAPLTSTSLDRWALSRIQGTVRSAPIGFALWDGFELRAPVHPPVATIVFKNRRALFSWVWDPDLNFGEAYMSGGVEIRGDLVAASRGDLPRLGDDQAAAVVAVAAIERRALPRRENVHHHYDLGNDFYRLWLDRDMVYTCAYFPTPDATLEARADREDGSRLPQAAAAARRARGRGRMRLGLAGAVHGASTTA